TGDRYVILKRYSDFYKLRADIVNSIEAQPVAVRGIIGHALMAFPEKKMFNNKTDETIWWEVSVGMLSWRCPRAIILIL
ncbi:hypothetical protein SARC_17609, partial [Sphaeroforma arctica JP610]